MTPPDRPRVASAVLRVPGDRDPASGAPVLDHAVSGGTMPRPDRTGERA